MGVGTILLVVLLGVLAGGTDGYSAATGRIDANVEARAALTTFAADLSAVRYSRDVEGSFDVEQGDGLWPSSESWFFALRPRAAQERAKASGDLCFVHYYTAVTRELEGESGPYSRKLYRRLVSSADVMSMLREDSDLSAPAKDPERLEDEAVAFNVVQFLVEPKVQLEGSGEELEWTRDMEDGPDFVDVVLRVTDDRTAVLFPGEEDWDGEGELARRFFGAGPEAEEGQKVRTYQTRLFFNG
jgi:hypothetical protein